MNKTEYDKSSRHHGENMKLTQRNLKGPKTFKIPISIKNVESNNISGSFPNIRPLDILKNIYSDEAGKTIRLIQENKKSLLFQTEINSQSKESQSSSTPKTNMQKTHTYKINSSKGPKLSMKSISTTHVSHMKTNSLPEIQYEKKNFYCPYCTHCNKMNDDYYEASIIKIRQAKSIISKAVDYVIKHNMMSKMNCDLFTNTENGKLGPVKSKEETGQSLNFDFEEFNETYPRGVITNNKITYQIMHNFLGALSEGDIDVSHLVDQEVSEQIKELFLSQGLAFKEKNKEIFIDKELESLFDESSKQLLKQLYTKNYMDNLEILKREENLHFLKQKKIFLVIFLIFLQILSEIAVENKERSLLLYKCFKIYFVEQEKKWLGIVNKLKEKASYYRELCKIIIQQKNEHVKKVEDISEVLLSQAITKENLENHKKLINELLLVNNEKRDKIYLLKKDISVLTNELQLWIYDYENVKLNKNVYDSLKNLKIENIIKNVNEELKYKNLSREYSSLLVNADRFLLISNQRNYFYDQKNFYQSEIERLTGLYQKTYHKKRKYKKEIEERASDHLREIEDLNKEIIFLRQKIAADKYEMACQTDVNYFEYNKMLLSHDLVTIHKRLSTNKLSHYVERIQYNISKEKPISKKSLLNLIPDLYNEKIENDSKSELNGSLQLFFDDFLFKYLTDKFKLKKIIQKNVEQLVMSVLKYNKDDKRIDVFRRMLGIGDDKIRREVLDIYLTLLKNIPVSFFKLFDDEYQTYLMNLELCFEIYHTRYQHFNLVNDNRLSLSKTAKTFDSQTSLNKNVMEEKKLDYFLLNRFYNKSFILVQDLLDNYKNKNIIKTDTTKIVEQFQNINKEFKFSPQSVQDILHRNFQMKDNDLLLDSFFEFFANNKLTFKISIFEYLDISLNYLVHTFNVLEKKICKVYEDYDITKKGIIKYKDFEYIFTQLFGGFENLWKINEYFKLACGSQEKDFLSKEEVVIFIFNTKELITFLLNTLVRNEILY